VQLAPEYRDGATTAVAPSLDMFAVGVLLRDLFPQKLEVDLIDRLISEDPSERPTAAEALAAIREAEHFGVAVHEMRQCAACTETFPPQDILACESGHALCNVCYTRWVEDGLANANVHVSATGEVECFERSCDHSMSLRYLAAQLPESLFVRVAARARDVFQAELEETSFEPRLKAIKMGKSEEIYAQSHVDYIFDRILTTCCPRCNIAFKDFTGCFAIKCHKCPCYFCGWCLSDAGDGNDVAHQHVAKCRSRISTDVFFGSEGEFEMAMRKLREKRLRAYWSSHVSTLRDGLEERIRATVLPKLCGLVRPGFTL